LPFASRRRKSYRPGSCGRCQTWPRFVLKAPGCVCQVVQIGGHDMKLG
jgi:hypothetical protein